MSYVLGDLTCELKSRIAENKQLQAQSKSITANIITFLVVLCATC